MKLSRVLFAPALALAMVACGDSDPSGPDASALLGTWSVTSVEGMTLPFSETFDFEGISCTFTMSAMTITFASGGSFSGSDTSKVKCDGEPEENTSESWSGTYVVNGDRVSITQDHGEGPDTDVMRFTVSGNTLTIFETEGSTAQVITAVRK